MYEMISTRLCLLALLLLQSCCTVVDIHCVPDHYSQYCDRQMRVVPAFVGKLRSTQVETFRSWHPEFCRIQPQP